MCSNMGTCACRHIQNAKKYGFPVVIAINKFATDTDAELQAVRTASKNAGSFHATALMCSHGVCSYSQFGL